MLHATLFSSLCLAWWHIGPGPPDCSKEENVAGHGHSGALGPQSLARSVQILAPCVMAVTLSSVGPGRAAGNMAAVRLNRGSELNFTEMSHK